MVSGELVTLAAVMACAHAAAQPIVEDAALEPVRSDGATVVLDGLGPFVDGLVRGQMDAHRIPGAVIAITRGEDVLYLKGYGDEDIALGVKVDPELTLFRIGSVSKTFIWTAVLQLVERGDLDLDTDINAYLDFPIPATFEDPITLRHLLTHTPGFEDVNIGFTARSAGDVLPLGEVLGSHVPVRVFPAGRQSGYSNYGAALAAYIVERATDRPFFHYVEEAIFQPLGMERSTFRQPVPEALADRLTSGYAIEGGVLMPGTFEFMNRYPAGAMATTAADMAKFAIAHMTGAAKSSPLLSQSGFDALHTRHFGNLSQTSGMTFGFEEERYNGRRFFGHGGDIDFFRAKLIFLPEARISIFIAFNASDVGFSREHIVHSFMDRYFPGGPQAELFSDAPVDNANNDVAGTYVSSRRNFTTIEKIFWPLLTGVTVSQPEDTHLVVQFFGETHAFERVTDGVFAPVPGEDRSAAPFGSVLSTQDPTTGQRRLYFSQLGSFFFEETPPSESLRLHVTLVVLVLTLGLAGGALVARRPAGSRPRWSAVTLAVGALSTAGVLFQILFLLLAATFMNEDLLFGVPSGVRAAFALPLVGGVLAILSLFLLGHVWRDGSGWTRLHAGVVLQLTAVAIFVWQLNVWNLFAFSGLPG